uniref:NELL2-interacting cell ontogeny regulator 1 n=2 Tax=Paramormyrops kingsleyae TaxID=1676925 RepID=A0A3B3T3T3_9TELE
MGKGCSDRAMHCSFNSTLPSVVLITAYFQIISSNCMRVYFVHGVRLRAEGSPLSAPRPPLHFIAEIFGASMKTRGFLQPFCAAVALLMIVELLCFRLTEASQETGTVIPAESRPCVDCHAFEFMQRALQDLRKTAFNLDSRTESLVLRAERRALCDCMPTNTLS